MLSVPIDTLIFCRTFCKWDCMVCSLIFVFLLTPSPRNYSEHHPCCVAYGKFIPFAVFPHFNMWRNYNVLLCSPAYGHLGSSQSWCTVTCNFAHCDSLLPGMGLTWNGSAMGAKTCPICSSTKWVSLSWQSKKFCGLVTVATSGFCSVSQRLAQREGKTYSPHSSPSLGMWWFELWRPPGDWLPVFWRNGCIKALQRLNHFQRFPALATEHHWVSLFLWATR